MPDALLINACLLIAVVLALWVISVRIADVSFIDAFWGAGMAMLAISSFAQRSDPGVLAWLMLAMTTAWGFRLGLHLLRRWWRDGEDQRYERLLRKDRAKGRFALAALVKIWLGQAVLLFLVSSPAQWGILGAAAPAPMTVLAWAGVGLYLVGIVFEWVGDWQLARFKADPANEGEVLDTGLWRYTRHPNYFGDACAWWGIWLVCAAVDPWLALYTVAGPVFLTFTLTKWSGAALLESGMKKKRGDKYADYIARTSAFIPWPPTSERP